MTWYKATRPDGTSFYDSKTVWKVGETVKVPKNHRQTVLCGPGLLHISDAPAETLIGGSWPCRLFQVRPNKIVSREGHRAGCWSIAVVAELPGWQALGPNGQEVAALIERARTLTYEEAKKTKAARVAARVAACDAAWDAARDAVRVAARVAACDAAWAAGRVAACNAAWDAARDAAGALVVKDLITPEQFEILYGPWRAIE